MLPWLDRLLAGRPQWVVACVCMTLVMAVAFADAEAGTQWGLAVLSLVPIGLAAWYSSPRVALAVVLGAALGWLVHQPSLQFAPVSTLWNALARVVYFGLAARLVSEVRRNLLLESTLADTDPLTGLLNRRAFWERAELELERASRYQNPITIAYVDLDNFKRVNDKLGHEVGDEVLRSVAKTLQEGTRVNDLVARVGGDEIVVLLPQAGPEQGLNALRALRASLTSLFATHGWGVSSSVGAMTFWNIPEDVSQLVGGADALMYGVKRHGRDGLEHRVVGAPPDPGSAPDERSRRHSYLSVRGEKNRPRASSRS